MLIVRVPWVGATIIRGDGVFAERRAHAIPVS